MDKFFRGNPPRKGEPVSKRGFASGVMAMANALSNMQVHGGHVEWSAWLEPTIVIDPLYLQKNSVSGGTSFPDGSVFPARVAWDDSLKAFVQYYLGWTASEGLVEYLTLPTWNTETLSFDEAESATIIAKFPAFYSDVSYDMDSHAFIKYPLEWDSETNTFANGDESIDVVVCESHASQHED